MKFLVEKNNLKSFLKRLLNEDSQCDTCCSYTFDIQNVNINTKFGFTKIYFNDIKSDSNEDIDVNVKCNYIVLINRSNKSEQYKFEKKEILFHEKQNGSRKNYSVGISLNAFKNKYPNSLLLNNSKISDNSKIEVTPTSINLSLINAFGNNEYDVKLDVSGIDERTGLGRIKGFIGGEYSIGKKVDDEFETWSIYNYFSGNKNVQEKLKDEFDKKNKENLKFIDWFTKKLKSDDEEDKNFIGNLVEINWRNISEGYHLQKISAYVIAENSNNGFILKRSPKGHFREKFKKDSCNYSDIEFFDISKKVESITSLVPSIIVGTILSIKSEATKDVWHYRINKIEDGNTYYRLFVNFIDGVNICPDNEKFAFNFIFIYPYGSTIDFFDKVDFTINQKDNYQTKKIKGYKVENSEYKIFCSNMTDYKKYKMVDYIVYVTKSPHNILVFKNDNYTIEKEKDKTLIIHKDKPIFEHAITK